MKEKILDDLLAEIKDILIVKNRAYGTGEDIIELHCPDCKLIYEIEGKDNISGWGELGVAVRANDKVNRIKTILIKNLTGGAREAISSKDIRKRMENLEDTWLDMAVYSIIGLLVRRQQWKELWGTK